MTDWSSVRVHKAEVEMIRRPQTVMKRAENGSLEPFERNETEAGYLTSDRLISANLTCSNKHAMSPTSCLRGVLLKCCGVTLSDGNSAGVRWRLSHCLDCFLSSERASIRLGQSGASVCESYEYAWHANSRCVACSFGSAGTACRFNKSLRGFLELQTVQADLESVCALR